MSCDICAPQEKGYTVCFSDKQDAQRLLSYFNSLPTENWKRIDPANVWMIESIFFDFMDYAEAHLSESHIVAALADVRKPLKYKTPLKPIAQFKQEREASWIDDVIQNESIATHYQPIVSWTAGTLEIVGHELLSRGLDNEGKIIPPFKMFEAAKIRNRTFSLDRACRITCVKNAEAVGDKLIFINFIPTAIYVPEHCLATTIKLIEKLHIKPEQVVFEVVETEQIDDVAHLKSILNYYRSHGFKYALDDVGVGYNDVEMLSNMEPDFVKLAMEYTNGVSQDAQKQHVAKSVLTIAHNMGAKALAEGVEQEEDLLYLADMGYDLFQGYYLGKPTATPATRIGENAVS
ncbi:EAL domain-containing protein [Virgibacillus halodenitrificans]|uniref:EAL domain-containing protein n=1 Tax=Virgibacillus halodenitrificans TaxID=1482 RepID=A0ABR7VM55_VIRHA|nr:EAL domain-containing protein [Virgibacillus halodenitrificans]MBD1222381.1 EAL domain-containing protein [Virgibacillus halodenitrificans]